MENMKTLFILKLDKPIRRDSSIFQCYLLLGHRYVSKQLA